MMQLLKWLQPRNQSFKHTKEPRRFKPWLESLEERVVPAVPGDAPFTNDPAISIQKFTNGQDADIPTGPIVSVGSTVVFTYFVENTGNVPLTNPVVTDDNGTPGNTGDDFNPTPITSGGFNVGDTNQNDILDVDEIWQYTESTTAVAGQYTNIADVTADDPTGNPVTDDDPSNHFGQVPTTPNIDIEKLTNGQDADTPTGPVVSIGSTVDFTYFVTNTGTEQLTNVVVTDDNGTPGTGDDFNPPPVLSGGFNVGDLNMNNLLDPGEIWEYAASTTAVAGQYTNIADVTADPVPGGGPVTDSDPSNHFGEADDGCDFCNTQTQRAIEFMEFTYTGGDCTFANNGGNGQFIGDCDPVNLGTVHIEVYRQQGGGANDQVFSGSVNQGNSFLVDGNNGNHQNGFLVPNIFIQIFDSQGGDLLQEIRFHTSCSAPVLIGAQLGGVQLIGVANDAGESKGSLSSLTVASTRFSRSIGFYTGTWRHSRGEQVTADPVTQEEVDAVLEEAIRRWELAGEDVSGLADIEVNITDLSGSILGLNNGQTIWIDAFASGYGWFIDPTLQDDSEFSLEGDQGEQGRMDLLTVLTHEVGHLLGYSHDSGLDVMIEALEAGTRYTV